MCCNRFSVYSEEVVNLSKVAKLTILSVIALAVLIYVGYLVDRKEAYNDRLSSVFYESYMEGCSSTNASYEYCRCTFDYLDRELTNKRFYEISVGFVDNPGVFPDEAVDAVQHCIHLFDQ